jgi:putative DNA primase/helicase
MQYLQSGADAPRARLIPYTGWHDGAFVLPDAVIGCANEALIYSGKLRPPVEEVGTLEGWRDGVAKYAVGNPLLALTLGAGFAGALLRLSGMDSGGFHIAGDSKAGKSTVCDMAASIYGQPKDYRQTWHGTATGIEYTSAAFNDLPLVLDEIGQGDPKAVDTVVYMLSQGKGKARGRDSGGLREATRWCCFLLSNGEHDLATYLQMGGKEIKAGQAVRLLSLQARRQFGAFDELHGFSDAPALCAHIATQAQANHGTTGRAFLARLADADHPKLAQQMREYAAAFAAVTVPQGASPQVRHASQYFALVGFAGLLATDYGLTGWPDGEAFNAAKAMFTDWLHHRGGMGNEEDKQILQQVRYFFEQHGMARFARWDDEENAVLDTHSAKTLAMCGYRKTIEINTYGDTHGVKASEVVFYILGQSWANDVLKGRDTKRANRLLVDMGILQPDTSGKASRLIRLPAFGKNPIRCYVLNQAALYAGAEID